MFHFKGASLATVGLVALSLSACSTPSIKEGWMHGGYHQWHTQAGAKTLAQAGTQCFFCNPSLMDSDGDGVMDDKDQCPDTPKGFKVDSVGCIIDSDGDGVTDDKDQCPKTPKGFKVDSVGCIIDSDGDGVTDDKDQCPDTPKGVTVDTKGCPLDTDGDGVLDYKDTCPGTPKGAKVNHQGCWVMDNLHFDTNKFTIKPVDFPAIDEVLQVLQQNPEMEVEVQGHTDNVGSRAHNQTLSENRAKAVTEYLKNKGIAAGRMILKGFGFDKPASSNDTAEGRAQNRRVQLEPVLK